MEPTGLDEHPVNTPESCPINTPDSDAQTVIATVSDDLDAHCVKTPDADAHPITVHPAGVGAYALPFSMFSIHPSLDWFVCLSGTFLRCSATYVVRVRSSRDQRAAVMQFVNAYSNPATAFFTNLPNAYSNPKDKDEMFGRLVKNAVAHLHCGQHAYHAPKLMTHLTLTTEQKHECVDVRNDNVSVFVFSNETKELLATARKDVLDELALSKLARTRAFAALDLKLANRREANRQDAQALKEAQEAAQRAAKEAQQAAHQAAKEAQEAAHQAAKEAEQAPLRDALVHAESIASKWEDRALKLEQRAAQSEQRAAQSEQRAAQSEHRALLAEATAADISATLKALRAALKETLTCSDQNDVV